MNYNHHQRFYSYKSVFDSSGGRAVHIKYGESHFSPQLSNRISDDCSPSINILSNTDSKHSVVYHKNSVFLATNESQLAHGQARRRPLML